MSVHSPDNNNSKETSIITTTVALVGSPNVGKTTLYNWLTGSTSHTVNYPGATVDYSIGELLPIYGITLKIIDTPGIYSLFPKTLDEEVTKKILFQNENKVDPMFSPPQVIVVVIDATSFCRNLNLAEQIKESGYSFVIALTMMDLITEQNKAIDFQIIAKHIGAPVIPICGQNGHGIQELVNVLQNMCLNQKDKDQKQIASHSQMYPNTYSNPVKYLCPITWDEQRYHKQNDLCNQLYKLAFSDAISTIQLSDEKQKSNISTSNNINVNVNVNALTKTFFIKKNTNFHKKSTTQERTKKIDAYALHPFFGPIIFMLLMSGVFIFLFYLTTPFTEGINYLFAWISNFLISGFPDSLWIDFFANGVLNGFGAFFVFIPQIFVLFLSIHFLEDSGYLARAAALADRPLEFFGLNGRCFVPFLSGFACAVPAILAARTIPNTRERKTLLFLLPLLTCSAKLPVYALFLSFLFQGDSAWKLGLSTASLYAFSLLLAIVVGKLASHFFTKDNTSFLLLELPYYRRPKIVKLFRSTYERSKNFIFKAGPIIFVLSILIWTATTFPRFDLKDKSQRLQFSYAAKFGKFVEPIMKPMGLDWRVGIGIISSFAAREVFVSTLAMILDSTPNKTIEQEAIQNKEKNNDKSHNPLAAKMKKAQTASGESLFTTASVLGLMVFYIFAMQCMATMAVSLKESGSWKFVLNQIILFNLLAYGLAVIVVQSLRFFGIQ